MKLPPRAERRPGFTLVEMLVVLGIIIVLVSLVAAAVLQFLGVGPRTVAQYEISSLNHAVESFKSKYGMYPPSKIFLANTQADYANAIKIYTQAGDTATAQVIQNSLTMINKIFTKLDWLGTTNNGVIDWTGNGGSGPIYIRFKGTFLEGDQALVFFLGGIQTSSQGVNGCLGFAANSRNPTLTTGPRIDPLYEFPSKRLATVTRTYLKPAFGQSPNTFSFFVYTDPFDTGVPYIYFSTYGTRNGYLAADCASQVSSLLKQPVTPYFEATQPTTRYLNQNTFQIISAGPDGDFGAGGPWNPGLQPVDRPTKDNQSNFNNGGLMGTRS